ncbi:flagellar hook-associated protein FlgL [Ornithinibacillus sp. L9]|uniref:Flagellar hook-associated protein FlgL n=1 Tax=Ornithinibacillus caprae TaxID=2678566 RepID=A0A6N8FNA5_9BACI|nr:flagellar hook-associated protein FlgL [Ornithinibacillus caprae]MUK90803.1 flagellar hook-associated protein FlgL [Ornithinibacillus caprae]
MRVTQGMLSNNMLKNLSNSYSNLGTYMDQLSTGKKINRPSDDPVIAMKGMNYRSQLIEVEQHIRNTNEVHNWMDSSDAALDKATQALQKLRELAVQASNDTYGAEERKNIMAEAEQIKEHLVEIANTKVNGKYIFNGADTNVKPIDGDANAVEFNTETVLIEVANGTKLQANVNAEKVFGNADSNVFQDIDSFITALGDNNQENIQQSLDQFDNNINNVVNARADLGARMNRLELVENRLAEQEVIATQMMSKNEDIDYEKVITNLITQESVHRAALSAGSRIIQPSLLDFLR